MIVLVLAATERSSPLQMYLDQSLPPPSVGLDFPLQWSHDFPLVTHI